MLKTLKFYQTINGKIPFLKWFDKLDIIIKTRVRQRLDRLALGQSGIIMIKKQKKNVRTVDYHDWLINSLSNNPKEAEMYLQAALEEYQTDGNTDALLLAMRHVAEARGGISKLSRQTKLNRESLYKTLSTRGNPRLQTFGVLLNALGFHLSIRAI